MSLPETLLTLKGWQRQEDRAFLRAGTIAALIVEVNRDHKKRSRPYAAEDIFPHLAHTDERKGSDSPAAPQSSEQQLALFKALMNTDESGENSGN